MAKKKLRQFHIVKKNITATKKRNISFHKEVQKVKSTSQVSKNTTKSVNNLTPKQSKEYSGFLKENNLTRTQKSFQKFRAHQNKLEKIARTEKALSKVQSTLSEMGISEKWTKIIKSNVIGYYRGAVGFTEKQYAKLVNDMAKLNDLDLAKKVLPKIARPDTTQLKWAKKAENLKDLTTALFRDDGDIYLELKDLIIAYNNGNKKYTNKEEGVKNVNTGEYLSFRWQQEKELKAEREQEELAQISKYF